MLSTRRSILRLAAVLALCQLSLGASFIYGEPLFVKNYLERGDVLGGQQASRTPAFFGREESYSGYLTVNKSTGSHMFFWYFKAEVLPQQAPVILWLQGGPGASSLAGAFLENGPYNFVPGKLVSSRDYHWSQRFHVLYIDNPVGAGYSFTEGNDYAVDECQIGATLYEAVTQFFTLFPELRLNDFYIAGESYAGKYVPALAYHIHINNPQATNTIKLRGITLGNAIIDPPSQLDNGNLYYQLGLLDKKGLKRYKYMVKETLKLIMAKSWHQATRLYYALSDSIQYASGLESLYNFVKNEEDIPLSELELFLNDPVVKQVLHVGPNAKFHARSEVAFEKLSDDRTKSVKSWFLEILENYSVLVYNGQLDLVKPYSGMVNFINEIGWSGAEQYYTTPKTIWKVNGDVAGYNKTIWHLSKKDRKPIKFTEILIRNAGHLVPRDQPLWAMAMMMDFTGLGSEQLIKISDT